MNPKQIKQNLNYFTKTDRIKSIGIGILVLGCILAMVGWYFNYYFLMIGSTLLPVGIVVFYLGVSGRATDTDLDAILAQEAERWQIDPEEDRRYAKRIWKRFEALTVAGYEYRDGVMLKKAKNGNLRSSEYTLTRVVFLTDALYCAVHTMSLVGEHPQDRVQESPYDAIRSVELLHSQANIAFGDQIFAAKPTELAIAYGDTVFRCPVTDDMNSEELIQKIQKAIREYRKEQEQA